MAKMEQLEMDAHRTQLVHDVAALVDKYRTIFEWDVPEIDEGAADRLILAAPLIVRAPTAIRSATLPPEFMLNVPL